MKKTIKYLQDGEYHYATVKDVGDLEQLKTKHKEDLVTALNELFTTGGEAKPAGYDDLVKKVNDTQTNLNGINGEVSSVKDKVNGITSNGGGTNLIVQSDLKGGYLDRGNGSANNNGSYNFHLDSYIPTNGSTVFTFSSPDYVFKGSGNHTLAMYDSDKNFLGYQLITSPTQTLSKSNVAYIRFSINFVDEGGTTNKLSDWLSTHRYMLEKGIIAHDWSPSPQDVATDISNVNTKIDQTANGINNTITDINGKVVANDEAIAQAKKDLQDALTQFQTFNDEIEQAKKDAETKLADAKQALKDEFNNNLADAQKANQKQLEDKVAVIQGNLDTTSNMLNDVKTQLTNAKLDYGNVNVSIQKLNDMLSTKLSSTDLDPLRTSIQNQESEIQQTKDSIATKAGKDELNVLSGRVSNTEAKIKQQADEISLGVKKSELNGAIDNYQVEGTNRLRDTIDFDIDNGYWKLDQYSINSNTDVHPYDQAHDISALVLQKTGSAKQDVDFTNEDLGNSFVVSVWNKKDAQPQVWYGNTQLTNRQVSDIKGDYERSFFTFIPTNINVKTIMFKYDAGTVDQLVIGEPKLELGTKPKAYAPNPNDEHKQIVNTKAELKIASDKIESTVEKQTKTDDNINQLSSRVTQTEQGITATNDLITKTKDGLVKDYTGKIDASAKSLSSEFEEKTNEKIGQITDSGENLILNSAFTNETDRKDKWQNISDKVNIVDDGNGLMWAKMSQSGLTADNPISLTSNYFPIKQGKITVGVDIKSDNTDGLSGAKILVLQTYNANKQRVDFTEISLENMGLTVQQLADGQSHRGVYRLGNDRSDAVYMTVKAVLPRNGSIYFTNFSAKLSSIDNGGYTPNADDLKRQIFNQKTKIEQNSQQITLKASSTELRDVRTIANGAVSSANNANNNASSAMNIANTANSTASNAVNTANQANTTANSVNSKITAIQANGGGRNLARGTSSDWTDFTGFDNKTNYSVYPANIYLDTLQVGDTMTWGITLKNTGITSGSFVLQGAGNVVYWSKGALYGKSYNISNDLPAGTTKTFVLTTVINEAHKQNEYFSFQLRTDNIPKGGTLSYRCVFAEKGTVAHEWTPAPEDIQSQIDQARTDIQSTLTVANNGSTAATNLKTTYDNYVQKNDANIKLLGDRITNEVSKITSNGGGRNLVANTGTDIVIDATSDNASDYTFAYLRFTEQPKQGDLITVSAQGTLTGTGNLDEYQVVLYDANTTRPRSQAQFLKAGKRDSVTLSLDNLNGDSDTVLLIYAGKAGETKGKKNVIHHLMVEKGTIAHDWQASPEDTDARITDAKNAAIQVSKDSITSEVSDVRTTITQVNNKVDNLQIGGGRNLLIISSFNGNTPNFGNVFDAHWHCGNNTTWTFSSDKPIASNDSQSLQFTPKSNLPNVDNGIWYIAPQVKAGEVYTFGFWGKSTSDGFKMEAESFSDISKFTMTTAWKYYSGQLKFASDNRNMYFRVSEDNSANVGTVTIFHPMLEKGVVAHDWTPAPEDVATDISNVNTKVEQYKTKIDQNEKTIALKADQTTVDKTNGAVQQLQAQLKVQSDQISSKVSSSDLDARGYATQAYTQTQIQQTADSINSTINNNQKNAESRFQQTDAKLSATVTKDQLQAGFNIADGKIDLMGKKLALTGDMIASGGPYKHNHVGYMGQRSGGWQSSENWQIDGERFNFTSDDIPIAGNRFVYSRFLIDEILGLKTYTSNADERMNGPYVTDRFLERKGNHVYDFINRKDVPDDAPENAGAIKITALGAGDISNNYIGLKYMFLDMSKHFVDTTKVLVPKDNALYMKQGGKKLYGEQYMVAGVNAEAGTEIKNWYYFDKNDRDGAAAMDKFVTLADGRVVHYDSNGIMDHGEFMVGTDYYYADLVNGDIRKNAIGLVQEIHQLHYYGADGKRQTGNITIKNKQYTFDANTGALTRSTKGEFQIGDDYYCLVIPYLGYIATGWYMLDDGRYVYYDPTTGAMVHGKHKIDGHTYNFTYDGTVLDEDRVGNYTADKNGLDFAALTSTDAPYYDNDLIDASDQNKYVYTYGKNIDNQFDVDPNRLYWAFKNGSLSKAGMIPNQKYLMEFEWWMSGDAEYYGTFYPQLSEYPWQFNNKDIDWPVKISKQNNSGVYKRIISDSRDFSKVSDVKATGMVIRLDNVIGKLNVRNFHIIPLDTGMENKDATISFYARSLNGNVKLHVQDATNDVVTLTNQWQRYQVHLKCKGNASTVKFYLENSGIFEISMPKYELGTSATPWIDNGVGALAQKRESSISPFDGIVSKWSNATGEDTTQVSLRPDTGLIATDVNNQFIYAKPNKAQLLPNSLNLMSGLAGRSMEYTSEGFTYTGRDGKNLIFSIPYLHSITDVDTQYGTIYDFVASQNNRVNLIRNSNFSNAQDGWNMGSGCWATTDDFVNGAPYLQISIDTNTNGYAWQEAKWMPAIGQTLMVSVKVRKDIAHHIDDANAGVLLDFGNGGNIFLNPNWDSVKFGRWTQLAWGPIPVPAHANYFHPNLYLKNNGGKGWARICFSEFCVYPGIDIRPYSKG